MENKHSEKKINKSMYLKFCMIVILIVIIIATVFGYKYFKNKEETPENTEIEISDIDINNTVNIVSDGTEHVKGDLVFKNIKINKSGAANLVTGTIVNNGNKEENFKFKIEMIDSINSRTLGISEKSITNLKSKKSQDFTITVIGDYSAVDKFNIEIL